MVNVHEEFRNVVPVQVMQLKSNVVPVVSKFIRGATRGADVLQHPVNKLAGQSVRLRGRRQARSGQKDDNEHQKWALKFHFNKASNV
jgi:hypothetical protein